jgi:hypothetical protein
VEEEEEDDDVVVVSVFSVNAGSYDKGCASRIDVK